MYVQNLKHKLKEEEEMQDVELKPKATNEEKTTEKYGTGKV